MANALHRLKSRVARSLGPVLPRPRRENVRRALADGSARAEGLEERRLFALAVAPLAPATPIGDLANQIVVPNTGLNVTGGSFLAAANQSGTYTGFDISDRFTRLTISNGILLTSGAAVNALGPNDSPAISATANTGGDADLSVLVGNPTFDANSVTFNFTVTPGTNSILFDFVFGSDEYREFVGSPFNDPFAAFLDGVPVSFDINNRPITVNNNFFRVDNTFASLDIEYDGLTPRIRTQAPLNSVITNHTLKFAIADCVDSAYDSGVFISRFQGSPRVVAGPITTLPQPGVIQFSAPTYEVSETGTVANITLNRTQGTSGLVSVNYNIGGGTATPGADYTASSGTILFQDGQATQTLAIPILDDTLVEGNETIGITLSDPVDAGLLEPRSVPLTIRENENGIQFSAPVFSVVENQAMATVTVERFGDDLSTPATINFSTSNGTAATPTDYNPSAGTLTFEPNVASQTFTVPVRNDFEDEPDESVTLTLTNITGTPAIGLRNTAEVRIVNYDRPPTIHQIHSYAPRGKIEALFITYNEDMVPERAVDLANYSVFVARDGAKPVGPNKRKTVAMRSASYDVAGKTVTLRPVTFMKQNLFYEVVVRTRTTNGVRSRTNQMLDGNVNGVLDLPQFGGPFVGDPTFGSGISGYLDNSPGEDFVGYFARGNRLSYSDRNGDKVRLGTAGAGVLEVVRDAERDARVVRVVEGSPATTVYGTVAGRRGSDLFTDIDELYMNGQGTSTLNRPMFRVGTVF